MAAPTKQVACLLASIAVATAALVPVSAYGATMSTGHGGWMWRNPKPQGNSINAVAAIGATKAWGVGDAGTILNTTNGGKSWKRQTAPVMKNLYDVDFVDSAHGWAVGGNDGSGGAVVLRTTNGGKTWKNVASLPLSSSEKVAEVDFVIRGLDRTGSTGGHVYKSADGGKKWRRLSLPPLGGGVRSLEFVGDRPDGFAATVAPSKAGKILKTKNGGKTWKAYSWIAVGAMTVNP